MPSEEPYLDRRAARWLGSASVFKRTLRNEASCGPGHPRHSAGFILEHRALSRADTMCTPNRRCGRACDSAIDSSRNPDKGPSSMPSGKRDDIRSAQRWSKPERSPASRRGREHWVVRWIGAASFRRSRLAKVAAVGVPGAQIIQLSWADALGRPLRIVPVRLFQFAAAPLLAMLTLLSAPAWAQPTKFPPACSERFIKQWAIDRNAALRDLSKKPCTMQASTGIYVCGQNGCQRPW